MQPVSTYTAVYVLIHSLGTQSGRAGCLQVCNNLALAIQMASVAEAAALGKRLGLDAAVLADIFNSSSARCWSSDSYHPVPVTPLPLCHIAIACQTVRL